MSILQGGELNVAGHKIPLSMLAIVAAIGAALLLVRQMRANQSALTAGTPPAPVDLTGSLQPIVDQLGATTQALQAAAASIGSATSQGTGQQVNGSAPPPIASAVTGSIAGQDAGFFYGPAPSVPQGDTLVWRYTSAFLANHPEFSNAIAVGSGPPSGQPAPQYSWEWAIVPSSQVPGSQGTGSSVH